jgi:hypothetical protein
VQVLQDHLRRSASKRRIPRFGIVIHAENSHPAVQGYAS